MDCDYCIVETATINDVCLPVLLKTSNTQIDMIGGWEKNCEIAHRSPDKWGFCRIKNKKVCCCTYCKSFV